MSQRNPSISDEDTAQKKENPAAPKSRWSRTLALVGVFMTMVGLFMGGLLKDNPTGIAVLRVFFIGGIVCLLVGLAGAGMGALKKRAGKTSA
jgi:hypothetical protein